MLALDRDNEGGGALTWHRKEEIWWAVSSAGLLPNRTKWRKRRVFRDTSATQRLWYPSGKWDAFCRDIALMDEVCFTDFSLGFSYLCKFLCFSEFLWKQNSTCCKTAVSEYLTIYYNFCWVMFELGKGKDQKYYCLDWRFSISPVMLQPQEETYQSEENALTSCIPTGTANV